MKTFPVSAVKTINLGVIQRILAKWYFSVRTVILVNRAVTAKRYYEVQKRRTCLLDGEKGLLLNPASGQNGRSDQCFCE